MFELLKVAFPWIICGSKLFAYKQTEEYGYKPAARVSLKERLAEMKAKVAGNQVEKPVVKEKGKEETL